LHNTLLRLAQQASLAPHRAAHSAHAVAQSPAHGIAPQQAVA
jgi:hypothetical protein